MRRAGARGQGTVEAALGLLLITSILVFGIHFSEVAIMSLNVQEAAAAAIWDATAMKMSDLATGTPSFAPRDNTAIPQAQNSANTRYADLDGRQGAAGSAPRLVFTQATPATVTCVRDNSVMQLALPGILGVGWAAGQGGMTCSARSNFSLVPGFATSFLAGQLFQEQHAQVTTYPICSTGRAQGGACPATTFVLLGDWGLGEGTEALNCEPSPPGIPCANPGYYLMVQQAWAANGGSIQQTGNNLTQWLFGTTWGTYFPALLDETAFLMAAVGEDGARRYQWNNPAGEHRGFGDYTVTPGGGYADPLLQSYQAAAGPGGGNSRDPCVFGLPCNARQWPQYP